MFTSPTPPSPHSTWGSAFYPFGSRKLTQTKKKQNLGANVFTGLDCDPNPVFVPKTYSLPHLFFLGEDTTLSFSVAPMQFHTLALATFASLIAPFGGFFASGLKRTFKIKDFGQSIPGHGGMTDRMDCQFIMGFFAHMYYHSFIAVNKVQLGNVMELAITGLTVDEQIELVKGMGRYLANQDVWGTEVSFLARYSMQKMLNRPPPQPSLFPP